MGTDLRRRLKVLEDRSAVGAGQLRDMERDAQEFTAHIEHLSRNLDPLQVIETTAFRDSIIASRDPFLIKAFRLVEYGDWQL